MFVLYKIAGAFAAPPGLFITMLLAAACAAAAKARGTRRGCWNTGALPPLLIAAALYVMSVPAGAGLITGPLETKYSAGRLPPDGEEAAVLVLGGGYSYDSGGASAQPSHSAFVRIYDAVTLAQKRGGRSVLIFSGGIGDGDRSEAEAMLGAARAMGWRGETILEEKSRTTAENMKYSAEIIRSGGFKNVIIVTNAFHAPRAMQLAWRRMPDADIFAFAPTRQTDPIIRDFKAFLPRADSLYLSCLGAKERLGIAFAAAAGAIRQRRLGCRKHCGNTQFQATSAS